MPQLNIHNMTNKTLKKYINTFLKLYFASFMDFNLVHHLLISWGFASNVVLKDLFRLLKICHWMKILSFIFSLGITLPTCYIFLIGKNGSNWVWVHLFNNDGDVKLHVVGKIP
jgi:hypothetical protein